jgi:hypothetical protein
MMEAIVTKFVKYKNLLLAIVLTCAAAASTAYADPRDHHGDDHRGDFHRGYVLDHRYEHNHYYPPRGYATHALPSGYRSVYYRGAPYYFHGGVWYRSYGPRYVVVAPPIGAVLPILPPFYSTVWFSGVPYYYADDTYYVWRDEEHGYVVAEPPADAQPETKPVAKSDVFIYPKNGQSEQQQATDRYECHRWAADQTGFDPTQSAGGVSAEQNSSKRSEYQRAQAACLEGRGYTVK